MMCLTFLFVIFSPRAFREISKNQESLKKPWKSRNYLLASSIATATAACHYGMTVVCGYHRQRKFLTWKLPQPLQLLQPSFLPWGCYLRRIIDAERVCKLACKRAEEDCSTSVACNATRCVAQSIKHSVEA